MVYSNRFVACILVNGVPQKEFANGVVQIPFGSKYSLRFRNKNDLRAVVKFKIDGEDASGSGYVIPANSYIDIHRYAHKDVGFKFVDVESPEAVDFGKNNNDQKNGLIETQFFLEKKPVHYYEPYKVMPDWTTWGSKDVWPQLNNPYLPIPSQIYCSAPPTSSGWCVSSNTNAAPATTNSFSFGFCEPNHNPQQDLRGCTVEGASTGQKFTTTYVDLETSFTPITITLKGKPVVEKITVQKPVVNFCTECGKKRTNQVDKFCAECGTKF